MPRQFYGPLQRYQRRNRFQAQELVRMGRTLYNVHRAARQNDVYSRVLKGLKSWAKSTKKSRFQKPKTTYSVKKAKATNGFVGNTYAGKNAIAGKNEINKVKRPVKGNFKPRGTVVVNKTRGKMRGKQIREYPKSVYQTYFLSGVELDAHGNIGATHRKFTNMSVDSKTSTGFLMNLGCNCLAWDPASEAGKIGNFELAAKGDATVDNPNPFWQINGSNTDLEQNPIVMKQTRLPETATPYNTGKFPAVLKYTIPNHVIGGVNLNLSFSSASVCDQIVTVTLLRNISSEPTQPGMWSNTGLNGGISGADTKKILCNDIRNTTGRQYETLFRTSRYVKGINLKDRDPPVYFVKKNIKCNYVRTTCRRVTSALDNTILGGQWAPTFEIDESGALYNNLVLKVMTKCITKDKIVSRANGTPGSTYTNYYEGIPELVNMDAPPEAYATTLMKSRIRYGGTVGVQSYVREYSRGLGGDVATTVAGLQEQIVDLQSQISDLAVDVTDAHAEIDEHLADECPHSDADDGELCDEPEESYTHTHGGDTELHVYGHAREHSHPETTSHSHDDAVVS